VAPTAGSMATERARQRVLSSAGAWVAIGFPGCVLEEHQTFLQASRVERPKSYYVQCGPGILSSGPSTLITLFCTRTTISHNSNKTIYANLKYEKGTTQLVYVLCKM
jgi:hypothetical protein